MKQKPKPGGPTAGRERRRFTRVALDAHVAVTVIDTNTLFHSRIRDLSENGVFVVTDSTRPIGTNIRLSITVRSFPGASSTKDTGELLIEARGIIVHEVPLERAHEGGPAGIGVMFVDVRDDTLALLRRLVSAGERVA